MFVVRQICNEKWWMTLLNKIGQDRAKFVVQNSITCVYQLLTGSLYVSHNLPVTFWKKLTVNVQSLLFTLLHPFKGSSMASAHSVSMETSNKHQHERRHRRSQQGPGTPTLLEWGQWRRHHRGSGGSLPPLSRCRGGIATLEISENFETSPKKKTRIVSRAGETGGTGVDGPPRAPLISFSGGTGGDLIYNESGPF